LNAADPDKSKLRIITIVRETIETIEIPSLFAIFRFIKPKRQEPKKLKPRKNVDLK
jgi:hypothetical protein